MRGQAARFGAKVRVTAGDALAERLSADRRGRRAPPPRERAPRLIEVEWGNPKHPRVAIVGKGVCFDSGGLDIKPAAGMRLMKKDMGGAAHALALFGLVAGERLPVRLHLLIPAVENAVSGAAYRPGDIVKSRNGLFVEIDNTDAEGRLILADALTRAAEDKPELIVDFATLTGAARIALGPDLPALFANGDELADSARGGGQATSRTRCGGCRCGTAMTKCSRATSPTSPMPPARRWPAASPPRCSSAASCPTELAWAHLDTFAWRPKAKPGRPKGGDAWACAPRSPCSRERYPRS